MVTEVTAGKELAELLATGTWTHDFPITVGMSLSPQR